MIAERIKELMPPELQQITYIGELPTDVDNCIALMEFGGPHGTYFNKHDEMNEPYLRLYVRNMSYPNGYELIKACKKALDQYAVTGVIGIVLKGDVTYAGRDDKRRNLFWLTFKIFY